MWRVEGQSKNNSHIMKERKRVTRKETEIKKTHESVIGKLS